MRTFKYSTASYNNLKHNPQYQFSASHALCIYKSNSIYSFIPKNACSTMRLSLAMANGFIKDTADINWIHQNNDAFRASLDKLVTADYTFVILRCPYSRLLSAYLDKIVGMTMVAWNLNTITNRKVDPQQVTFRFFVKQMLKPQFKNTNNHWKPQTSFLVYDKYDDYFSFEDISGMSASLKEQINFTIVDARPLTKHGSYELNETITKKKSWQLTALELLNLRQKGQRPPLSSFYNEELIQDVSKAYRQDLELYIEHFGKNNLMFS